jgi:hypothetical protein
MISTLFQVAVAAAAVGSLPAEPSSGVGPGTVRHRGAVGEIEIATPSVASAEIRVDARLDEPVWQQAALLEGFTQFNPVEGTPASRATEVMVLVDSDAIYFGIKAFDDDPSQIRATLSERDSYLFSDDYIRIILDTFDDQRRAYVFTVNPLGVQHDGLWNEGGGSAGRRGRGRYGPPIDDNPDFLWDSQGSLTEWGYQAEVRIPFKSLRFPELEEQMWGLQIERKIQRNGFESSWAPITANVANRLTQAGKLTSLKNLDMGLFMEVNPVVTGSLDGALDGDGSFVHRDPTGDFGLNATYGVTSNLTLDATYNPDFSQVEADAGQIQVNERFALFFPEKRPFFLEGTEIFGMAKQLVYTRTIANPIAGGKLTGKVGGLSVGYLGAIDEPFQAGPSNTYVNLVRVRRDVGASSTIGGVYTDRTMNAGAYNRVAGIDTRLQLGGRYTLSLLGARSFTDGEAFSHREIGNLLNAQFERAGRNFSLTAELEDTDESFVPGSGFFQRIGDTQINTRLSYTWFGQRGALLESVNPNLELRGFWDHDAFWSGEGLEEGEVQLGWRVGFRDNVTFWGNVKRNMFSYAPEAYEGLHVQQADGSFTPFRPDQTLFDGLGSVTLSLWLNKWERVRGNVRYTVGDSPIFDRRLGVAVEPAKSQTGEVRLNLYPTRSLVVEASTNFSRLARQRDDVEHSTAIIPRVRAQYQFSRSLFVRGIFEYSTEESAELRDPATGLPLYSCVDASCEARASSEGHDFSIEGLISYEPSPGTVFFLGYSRRMQDSARFHFRDFRPTADGLFVKMSYRFRM